MYSIYHTPGFILKTTPFGEANLFCRVFTRELGLLTASAQGVRFLKSKLRYGLQEFSFSDLSLVRGRELWRVTGANKRLNLSDGFRVNPERLRLFARVFSLLERLLSGEERNEALFAHLESAVNFAVGEKFPDKLLKDFEYLLALRILASLGYLGESPHYSPFARSPYWSPELLSDFGRVSASALRAINQSMKETHL